MALIVEDGTGLAAADSYVSVADADAYHTAMGNAAWASATSDEKEVALRRATQYMDTIFQYRGERLFPTVQALEWPRDSHYFDDIAWRLEKACAELALRALSDDLVTDREPQTIKSETVGPLQTVYADVERFGGQMDYPVVNGYLRPLRRGSGMSLRVERAS